MWRKLESIVVWILSLALTGTWMYSILNATVYSLSTAPLLERILALILCVAQLFLLVHTLGYLMNIYWAKRGSRKIPEPLLAKGPLPSVALLVAARHEPQEILRATFVALKNLDYENKVIYFLDDSSDKKYLDEAEELCRELDLKLFRREVRHGAKAGIVNDCLKTLTEEYVALFDADQKPFSQFLKKLIPYFQADARLGFIQTPQFYSNMDDNRVARAASYQQSVFYEFICEGKNYTGSVFSCGTNLVFRKTALDQTRGLDESTVTEDFATSFLIHNLGWKSFYYPHVSTFGMGPENLTSYFKQQFRWAAGTLSVFNKLLWAVLTGRSRLSIVQTWEYFLSGSYYLVGLAFFTLMLFPLLYIFFDTSLFRADTGQYLMILFPYMVMPMLLFYGALADRHYKFDDLMLGLYLSMISFPVHIRAAVKVMMGAKLEFVVTRKSKGSSSSYRELWPQLVMIFLNFSGVVWAANRFTTEREVAILINGLWAFYHFGILSSLLYFNQDNVAIRALRLADKVDFEYRIIDEKPVYGSLGAGVWTERFTVFIPEKLKEGAVLMCKLVSKGGGTVIFDGCVLSAGARKGSRGIATQLGVVTISDQDRGKLKKMIRS